MKKSTKWILGIAIGLVCVVLLVAIGYVAFNWWSVSGWMMDARGFQEWGGGRALPWRGMPMHPDRGMPTSRFSGFYPLRMIASGLLCLGLLALIGLGVIALVRSLSRPTQPAEKPVAADLPSQTCSNCGRPVQDDWRHCPYCGNQLIENLEDQSPQS